MRDCENCLHRNVCGLYDAIRDAMLLIYNCDQTNPDVMDRLIEDLARCCTQYSRDEEKAN